MHGEMNNNDCFNNLIEMIVKICEIAEFTRATPGSFLVQSTTRITETSITNPTRITDKRATMTTFM